MLLQWKMPVAVLTGKILSSEMEWVFLPFSNTNTCCHLPLGSLRILWHNPSSLVLVRTGLICILVYSYNSLLLENRNTRPTHCVDLVHVTQLVKLPRELGDLPRASKQPKASRPACSLSSGGSCKGTIKGRTTSKPQTHREGEGCKFPFFNSVKTYAWNKIKFCTSFWPVYLFPNLLIPPKTWT